MFGTGHEGINVTQPPPLETFYSCISNLRTEVWIFSCTFHNPSPARVSGNIHHGGKSPVDTTCTGFSCCYPCRYFYRRHIPTACFSKRNRESDFVPVYHILTE